MIQIKGKPRFFYGAIFLLLILSFLFPIFLFIEVKNKKTEAPSYNVILISIDTLRADHMGIYGYDKNTTPYIDEWAKQAYVFTNAITVVPSTYASFVALMTGKHPFSTKEITVDDSPLNTDTPTFAKVLQSRGYSTTAFVNNGWIGPSSNLNAGFDEQYFLDWNEYKDVKGKATITRNDYEHNVNQSIEWIEKNKDKKFFLWVHLMDPHAPYNPPQDLQCVHNPDYCDRIRSTSPKDLEALRASYEGWENGCETVKPLNKDTVELFETLYDGEITYADMLVKKILDTVQRIGLDKKSIIILYGDHGEGFDHNYNFDHGILYQSNIHIPLIISLPGLRAGKIVSDLVDNTDILPTLLDLLGVSKAPYLFDGISFRGVFDDVWFRNPASSNKRSYVYTIDKEASMYGIYDGQYKYIIVPKPETTCLYKDQKEELYDTVNDPQEEKNIILQYPEIEKRLKSLLKKKIDEHAMSSYRGERRTETDFETLERLKSFGY